MHSFRLAPPRFALAAILLTSLALVSQSRAARIDASPAPGTSLPDPGSKKNQEERTYETIKVSYYVAPTDDTSTEKSTLVTDQNPPTDDKPNPPPGPNTRVAQVPDAAPTVALVALIGLAMTGWKRSRQ